MAKKTAFANVMALDKGIVLPNHATDAEIQSILDEWVLIEYIDNGERNANTPCECGRPLRYQYIVQHQTTKETRRFGITHFAEHTGLPAHIVKQIKDGFAVIDYERDELLVKLQDHWCLEDELSYLPNEFTFPTDLQKQLDAGGTTPGYTIQTAKKRDIFIFARVAYTSKASGTHTRYRNGLR
ncbi:hypothetical protein ACT7C6_27525 [Bacillus paranthracis]